MFQPNGLDGRIDQGEYEKLNEQVNRLLEVQTLLTAIIDSTQDAISVVDENGLGILINPAYTRLTGLTAEDVIGQPPTVDIAVGESMHMQVLKTGKAVQRVSMKVGPKGRDVLVNVAPIHVQGKIRGSVGVIHDVSEIRSLSEELEGARRLIRHLEAKYTFKDIIGESTVIREAIDQAQRAAQTPATVMLRGESGTGKEIFAHAIHQASSRLKGQFIRVNCAALTDNLLESELFGYVEGAFTGAKRGGKMGLFEEANKGTLFLDEIGGISLKLQSKLLRVLQEKELVKVGDNKPVTVDVRVIAATNLDLEEEVREGRFREDLYYRLNVIPIIISPLRYRLSDLPSLIHHLIRKFNQDYGRCIEKIGESALTTLKHHDWPGNVRELENVLGRAIINMRIGETVIEEGHLPILRPTPSLSHPLKGTIEMGKSFTPSELRIGFDILQQKWEKEIVQQALIQSSGNKTEAAQLLKMSIRNFYYKLERYEIE